LLTGDLTTLSPFQQLQASRGQFEALAGQAARGDATAAMGLPGAARTFLDASRGYNASGVGYAADFGMVQAVLASVETRFAGQLTVEERMLTALQTQVAQMSEQIGVLETTKSELEARGRAQITEFENQRETARLRYEAMVEDFNAKLQAAKDAADAQIAALRADYEAKLKAWEARLEALFEHMADDFGWGKNQGWGGPGGPALPPEAEAQWNTIASNTGATVTMLQTGLSDLSTKMGNVADAVDELTRKVKAGLEVAV